MDRAADMFPFDHRLRRGVGAFALRHWMHMPREASLLYIQKGIDKDPHGKDFIAARDGIKRLPYSKAKSP